jgi:hypothetical protein
MLSVIYVECRYSERRYAECHGAVVAQSIGNAKGQVERLLNSFSLPEIS